jgi:pimeloyl-ACP methyl ester carboxylesterase
MNFPAYHPFRSAQARDEFLALYDCRAEAWPLDSEEIMVDTSYGTTFARVSGPAGAPPLVLLPGAGGNSLMWIPNIEALSRHHRTYALDNIYDYGRSVYTRPIKNGEDFARWLDGLFRALALDDQLALVGMSFGAWISSQYSLRFPERLQKVVWLAPAGTVLRVRLAFVLRLMLSLLPVQAFTRSLFFWLFDDSMARDADNRAMVEALVDDWPVAARCFAPKRTIQPTVLTDEELRGLTVPTLCLMGENEKIYNPRKAVERLNRVAPQIETGMVPGAGHDLSLVQADRVNARVLAFLEDA